MSLRTYTGLQNGIRKNKMVSMGSSGRPKPSSPQQQPAPLKPPKYYRPKAYKAPKYEHGKVSSYAQRNAASGMRNLRDALMRASSATYENPNVRRTTLRQALQGYGAGVDALMAGATRDARAQYQTDYNARVAEAKSRYDNLANENMLNYTTAMSEYQRALNQPAQNLDLMNKQLQLAAAQRDFINTYQGGSPHNYGPFYPLHQYPGQMPSPG